jgi:hypothetical protein
MQVLGSSFQSPRLPDHVCGASAFRKLTRKAEQLEEEGTKPLHADDETH